MSNIPGGEVFGFSKVQQVFLLHALLELHREVGKEAVRSGEEWRLTNAELMDAYHAVGEMLEWNAGKNGS